VGLRTLYWALSQGDGFLVLPFPRDKEPNAEPQPITEPFPLPVLRPVPRLVPIWDGIMRIFTPIFDPSLLNDLDKCNPNGGRPNTET
jgi:hypothetical protein